MSESCRTYWLHWRGLKKPFDGNLLSYRNKKVFSFTPTTNRSKLLRAPPWCVQRKSGDCESSSTAGGLVSGQFQIQIEMIFLKLFTTRSLKFNLIKSRLFRKHPICLPNFCPNMSGNQQCQVESMRSSLSLFVCFSSCRLVRHFFSRAHRSDVICCSKEQVVSGVECDGKISRIVIIIQIVWLFICSSCF